MYNELKQRIETLQAQGGGTLKLSDGLYEIDRPLQLPGTVSLIMRPHAVIKASPEFKGEAVVIKDAGEQSSVHDPSGCIRGGIIDGGRQALTGLKVGDASRLEIAELEVRDATYKGIHFSGKGYELNLTNVRCNVDLHTRYAPESIGIHYESSGDSLVRGATVIGYETGVRSDTWANDISQVHVWNYDPDQGPMKYCFYANGAFDSYTQCYADSPTLAGFYVTNKCNRIVSSRVYYSRWAENNAGAGILVGPEGEGGTFMANNFLWDKDHVLAKKYDGHVDSVCILGDSEAIVLSE